MPRHRFRACLLASTFLLACSAPAPPGEVAREFWVAVTGGHVERAQALSTAASPEPVELLMDDMEAGDEAWSIQIDEVLAGEERALVRTSLTAEGEDGDPIVFHTTLRRFDDGWRVDLTETHDAQRDAAFADSIEDAQDAMRESAEAVGRAVEESMRDAADAMRKALEDVERALEPKAPPAGREL